MSLGAIFPLVVLLAAGATVVIALVRNIRAFFGAEQERGALIARWNSGLRPAVYIAGVMTSLWLFMIPQQDFHQTPPDSTPPWLATLMIVAAGVGLCLLFLLLFGAGILRRGEKAKTPSRRFPVSPWIVVFVGGALVLAAVTQCGKDF